MAATSLVSLDELVGLLPDLIADALRAARPQTIPGGITKLSGTVATAGDLTAEVQLDEDEPGILTTVQLAAAVSAGDRVVILLEESGGAVVVGSGNAQAGGNAGGGPFVQIEGDTMTGPLVTDTDSALFNALTEAERALVAAPALGKNPIRYGADPDSIITHTATATSIAADTFTEVAHGLVDGDYVAFTSIVTTTGISRWTTYRVRDATADTFKVALTPLGAAINLAGGDGTVALTAAKAASLAANDAAFALAWADARAADTHLAPPPGDYALSPGIIATDTTDAGIRGEPWRTNLWQVGSGILVDVRQTSVLTEAKIARQQSIEGIVLNGTFATGGSIGLRCGPGLHGYFNFRCFNYYGATGANGVTGTGVAADRDGSVGQIGMLCQNTLMANLQEGVTEALTFGPGMRFIECNYGIVYDRNDGHQSIGYQNHHHVVFRDCITAVLITNGAWLYHCNVRWEFVISKQDSFVADPPPGGTDVIGVSVIEGTLTGGGDPRPGSRLAGTIEIDFEKNDFDGTGSGGTNGLWTTSAAPRHLDLHSMWKSTGRIDALSASPILPVSTILGVDDTDDGPTYESPRPFPLWRALMTFDGDSNTDLVRLGDYSFTVKGNWTRLLRNGTLLRWRSGTDQDYRFGKVESVSFSTPLTTVVLESGHPGNSRTVNNGVSNGTPTVTSATAAFTATDVGHRIAGTDIPAPSYIGVINGPTSVDLSSSPTANVPVSATGSGSGRTWFIEDPTHFMEALPMRGSMQWWCPLPTDLPDEYRPAAVSGALLGSTANTVTAPTYLDQAGGGQVLGLRRKRGSATLDFDPLGFFSFGGFYDATNPHSSTAYVTARATEDFGVANAGTDMRFFTTAAGSDTPLEGMRITDDHAVSAGILFETNSMLEEARWTTVGTTAGSINFTSAGLDERDVGRIVKGVNPTLAAIFDTNTRIATVTSPTTGTLTKAALQTSSAGLNAIIGSFHRPGIGAKEADPGFYRLRSSNQYLGHFVHATVDTDAAHPTVAQFGHIEHYLEADANSEMESVSPGPRGLIHWEGQVWFGPNLEPKDAQGGPFLVTGITYNNYYGEDAYPGGVLWGPALSPAFVANGPAASTHSIARASGYWSNVQILAAGAGTVMEVGEFTAYQSAEFINDSGLGTASIESYRAFHFNPPTRVQGTEEIKRVVLADIGQKQSRNVAVTTVNNDKTVTATSGTPFSVLDIGCQVFFIGGNFRPYFITAIGGGGATVELNAPSIITGVGTMIIENHALATYSEATVANVGLRNAMSTVWNPQVQVLNATGSTILPTATLMYVTTPAGPTDSVLATGATKNISTLSNYAQQGQVLEIYNAGPGTVTYTDGEGVVLPPGVSSFEQAAQTIVSFRFFDFVSTGVTNKWVMFDAGGSSGVTDALFIDGSLNVQTGTSIQLQGPTAAAGTFDFIRDKGAALLAGDSAYQFRFRGSTDASGDPLNLTTIAGIRARADALLSGVSAAGLLEFQTNTTPAGTLQVRGGFDSAGTFFVGQDVATASFTMNVGSGVTTAVGNLNIGGGLGVVGAAAIAGTLSLAGSFIGTGKFIGTPTVDTISAAGSTIGITSLVRTLNNTSGGPLLLSSTPIIANGTNGQILILLNVSAQNIALRDHGILPNSNLRLGASTRTLGQRDTLTLMFNTSIGDWVEIAFTNVV